MSSNVVEGERRGAVVGLVHTPRLLGSMRPFLHSKRSCDTFARFFLPPELSFTVFVLFKECSNSGLVRTDIAVGPTTLRLPRCLDLSLFSF